MVVQFFVVDLLQSTIELCRYHRSSFATAES